MMSSQETPSREAEALMATLAEATPNAPTTDIANRYLTIWGRRSAERPMTVDTDTVSAAVVESVLWGAGTPWAPGEQRSRRQHLTVPASTRLKGIRG
jgi:hypothetical protein